jgi:Mrp family chromosome partitioning ATPase
MEFWLAVRNDKIEEAAFITDGCGSSLASGSMATCLAEGKQVEEAAAIRQEDILAALAGMPEESEHCALLAANTLKAACEDYLHDTQRGLGQELHGDTSTPHPADRQNRPEVNQPPHQSENEEEEKRKLQARLGRIRHRVMVLSGKGGVGKSMIAVNLAVALMLEGKRVGLLDVDIHGPSIPTMLGLEREPISGNGGELIPIEMHGLKVISIGFFLRSQDDAVIWRGPLKMSAIRQFLTDVAWGDLDFLVIDSPPGTGDEPLSVCQLIGTLDGAVIVTTPQKVAAVDVRKSITFCQHLKVPVLGVVENMSGFVCPRCGEVTPIFRSGGGKQIAQDMNIPFLGSIPIDPKIAEACDNGEAFVEHYATSPTAILMREIIKSIAALDR